MDTNPQLAAHDRAVASVTGAISALHGKRSFPVEVVTEGALKAVALLLLQDGLTATDAAALIGDFAEALRDTEEEAEALPN